jgi:hypothetical protein
MLFVVVAVNIIAVLVDKRWVGIEDRTPEACVFNDLRHIQSASKGAVRWEYRPGRTCLNTPGAKD